LLVDSVINTGREILSQNPVATRLNLAIATQVLKLVVGLFFLILIISTVIGKSPVVLLGGIGVLASVLMLVFKDVILGFVAGIQLSGYQMLSVGDWLEMPSHNADGDVEEIGLTTVKVRNFDKTITTVPTYALISSPFKNWRGMEESGGRRIKRSLLIDTNSIQLCSKEMVERFRQIEHIEAYLKKKEAELEEANSHLDRERLHIRVNGRRITNVGTFRAYIEGYLRQHPDINQSMTIIVRQLAPTGQGLPIEVYCFSAIKKWAAYESVQADIFDHLLAVASEFDLRVFQQPSGSDLARAFES
jgi:miniconductance mechanosensitive channel